MAIVNYHCAKGRLLGEDTNGIRTDYMTDALGSVTGTVNSSQNVINTYRYKPFGELLAKTGTGADPKFMWNGGTQSRRTGLAYSDQYNRARHYGTRQGQWTTVDPLWPGEPGYVYVGVGPVSWIDPGGQQTLIDDWKCGFNRGFDQWSHDLFNPPTPLPNCATHPGGPCAWAKARKLDEIGRTDGIGDLGGVICCAGRKHSCTWNVDGLRAGVIYCIKAHEDNHHDDVDCVEDGRPPLREPRDQHHQECLSYRIEIKCLTDARSRECGKLNGEARKKCESDYKEAICDACRTAEKYHRCSALPRNCIYCREWPMK